MALTDNLVSYYKLDANSNDSLGGNNGADTSISYVSGKIGNAANGGGTGVITIPSTTAFFGNDFTISLWVKPGTQVGAVKTLLDYNHNAGMNWVIQSESATTTKKWYLAWHNGTSFQGGGATNGVTLTDGVYQHVVFTKSGTLVTGYINNVSNWTFTGTGTINNVAAPAYLLDYSLGSRDFIGELDEVGFWNRALTAGEITQLYNSGNGLTYPFGSTTNASVLLFYINQ